ncbi:hypothetical protein AMECASPLE_021267 [Ameca splendens]|uniref:Uncharacterized protein n=1 Tax=Ameca splendens TaxID=208324 RepID=A0ABV0ZNB3_9TELE
MRGQTSRQPIECDMQPIRKQDDRNMEGNSSELMYDFKRFWEIYRLMSECSLVKSVRVRCVVLAVGLDTTHCRTKPVISTIFYCHVWGFSGFENQPTNFKTLPCEQGIICQP